jgi:hypothetical protein
MFAGGFSGNSGSDRVDVYNVRSGKWTIAALKTPRSNIAAASVGDVALFAGGFNSGTLILIPRFCFLFRHRTQSPVPIPPFLSDTLSQAYIPMPSTYTTTRRLPGARRSFLWRAVTSGPLLSQASLCLLPVALQARHLELKSSTTSTLQPARGHLEKYLALFCAMI